MNSILKLKLNQCLIVFARKWIYFMHIPWFHFSFKSELFYHLPSWTFIFVKFLNTTNLFSLIRRSGSRGLLFIRACGSCRKSLFYLLSFVFLYPLLCSCGLPRKTRFLYGESHVGPTKWLHTGPNFILLVQKVQLISVSTKLHLHHHNSGAVLKWSNMFWKILAYTS